MLKIAGPKGWALPDDVVTQTMAILGRRGTGKSNAAVVLAEEMYRAGHQWVAIDPKGDWYGIRAGKDGKTAGLPIPVFGGLHGDIPLEPTAGALMARLVVEEHLTCLLDVSMFSKTQQVKFVTDFAETLFDLIRRDPRPLHLFLEEAEEFLPQRFTSKGGAPRMVGAYSKISKQGRTSGLGVTLITQRSASLNKDALSQTGMLIAFQSTDPRDRKAIVDWVVQEGADTAVKESLPMLDEGESWVIAPGVGGEDQTRRVKWRRRNTFDSGATPVVGQKRRDPVNLADIDLGRIGDLMAETIERAEAEDPKVLKKRIADLERELSKRPVETETIEVPIEVRVPFIPDDTATAIQHFGFRLDEMVGELTRDLGQIVDDLKTAEPPPPTRSPVVEQRQRLLDKAKTHPVTRRRLSTEESAQVDRMAASATPVPASSSRGRALDDDSKLSKAERAILSVLASLDRPLTTNQIALHANYSAKSGGFRNALSSLRTAGLIDRGSPVVISEDGRAAIEGQYDELPTGQELLDYWIGQQKGSARPILEYLVHIYPRTATDEEVASACDYSAKSGGFRNSLSKLRTAELVSGGRLDLQAHDELMAAAGMA